jgi:ATP-dependent DNA helicase RecQ
MRLTRPGEPIGAFRIDWASIDRRRNAELSKLDAVQRYAYAKTCRRGFVLRYFGDPAARSHCEGCDNCLGITRSAKPASSQSPGQKRSKQGRDRNSRPGRAAAVTATDDVALSKSEEQLLAALRVKRLEIARKDAVPAYIVFSDRTLAEMAIRRPASLAALADVRGVGEMKLDRYGEQFLAVIRSSDETEAA